MLSEQYKIVAAIVFGVCLILLMIFGMNDVGKQSTLRWIPSISGSNNCGKETIDLNEEKIIYTNYEYFDTSLDCQDNSSFRNPDLMEEAQKFMSNEEIIKRCADCSRYFDVISSNGFAPITEEEIATPLAFAYTVHKEIGILEMFLALYFRPTDAHCIHVDAKADPHTFKTVLSIVQCYNKLFPESLVFMARQSIPVFWGAGGSILEADFICYRELMARSEKWKYVGNVAGTELPFVSIQRFRQRLKDSNGFSINLSFNTHGGRMKQYWELDRYIVIVL